MGVPRRFAAALFVAFLFYACQIVSLFNESRPLLPAMGGL